MGRYRGRKSGYERLNGLSGRRRMNHVQLGSSTGSGRRRFFWRIKVKPKFKFGYLQKLSKFKFGYLKKLPSPKNFLPCLRDAYVNLMLRLANSRVINSGYGVYGDGVVAGFGRTLLKEYDDRMILEIYKSLVITQSRQLVVSSDAPRFGQPAAAKLAAISE